MRGAAWERIADVVRAVDFDDEKNRLIYLHVGELIADHKPADIVTVAESLQRAGKLLDAGGAAYLAKLAQNTPSALNIRRYAELVRERAV